MPELIKSSRIIFPKGKQRKFLDSVQRSLGITQAELAELAGISIRSFTDWRREKSTLPFPVVQLFSEKSGVLVPKGTKTVPPYWNARRAGSAGAKVVLRKYGRLGGDVEDWRKKWIDWWKREGRFSNFSPIGASKSFRKPRQSSKLAEFIGIVLGDGGISKNQITITLHSIDDKLYAKYVQGLIQKLFNVSVGRYAHKHALAESMSISRIGLVQWFEKTHGLKAGNKVAQQSDVPVWIKNNARFSKVCVRGLIDTDGRIFVRRYRVTGKMYAYKKLTFTNYSKPLVYFVYQTLTRAGLHPRFAWRNGEEREVRLDSKLDMKKYFELIGTHNPKFLKQWRE